MVAFFLKFYLVPFHSVVFRQYHVASEYCRDLILWIVLYTWESANDLVRCRAVKAEVRARGRIATAATWLGTKDREAAAWSETGAPQQW